jgi:hypothetical protein
MNQPARREHGQHGGRDDHGVSNADERRDEMK